MVRTASKRRPPRRATSVSARPPASRFQGWRTTDDEEIERRRLRGIQESIRIEALQPERGLFSEYATRPSSGDGYRVEIRSLGGPVNSCDCPDYHVNGLGTCKHIEAVLNHLRKKGKRRFEQSAIAGSDRVEIFLDRRDDRVRIMWPRRSRPQSKLRSTLAPLFSSNGSLLAKPLTAIPALYRAIEGLPAPVRSKIRVSRQLGPWLDDLRRRSTRERARASFEADEAAGKRTVDVVNVPLYRYQREGVLHLAFTERALLADEMGLGKTVQAIAACELLRRLHGVERVLVVAPASLKAEWEEQIAKFTGLPSLIVQGPRAARLRQYREPGFFYLTNYEQIRSDAKDIVEILAPDVIILDEAQRIKNWQTKTAESVKRLTSPYAFVLTGTPLENRIDEIYSIVQFLDPQLFGPLFRFNRDFYQLDERGRPAGYRNLDELHRRLRPIMLRRRKHEVEGELPDRTVNTYFVPMDPEQVNRYEDYKGPVAQLAAIAKRRPLTKEEHDKMQKFLACMRMLCDTPYILDEDCRISPKLRELETILPEIMASGEHKVLIFSEWERMLMLVRELAERLHLEFAWHTGTTPQKKRRADIRRFKDDPNCRLFLSTDSGSVGLNLQAADVVVNLDLPWNPAKLEQRIARAWRKHQKRSVQVINLVSEGSIEHNMIQVLEQKQRLAEGVLDGEGKIKELPMPSGRAAFLERVQNLVGVAPTVKRSPPRAKADPSDQLREDVLARLSERVDLLQVHGNGTGNRTVLAVLDRADDGARATVTQSAMESFTGESPLVEVLDRKTYATIQRLIEAGVLQLNSGAVNALHRAPVLAKREASQRQRRLEEARARFEQADRQRRMAKVLGEGGFPKEALAPIRDAVENALRALVHLAGEPLNGEVPLPMVESELVASNFVPPEAPSLVAELRGMEGDISEPRASALLESGHALLQHAADTLERGASA